MKSFAHFELKSLPENNTSCVSAVEGLKCVFVYPLLCFSVRKKGAEDCKDLIDAFQACIKTLSEGS